MNKAGVSARREALRRLPRTTLRVSVAVLLLMVIGLWVTNMPAIVWVLALFIAVVVIYACSIRAARGSERWRTGASGEERTAKQLEKLGPDWNVWHDLALPGTKANIDHLVIGPAGIYVIDTKVRRSDRPIGNMSWQGRAVAKALGMKSRDVRVIVALWGRRPSAQEGDSPVVRADRLVEHLRSQPCKLEPGHQPALRQRIEGKMHARA